MKTLHYLILIFACACSSQAKGDQALRAFLDLRSSAVKLVPVEKTLWYVFTIAKFENGKFVGYGNFHTGERNPLDKDSELEIIWGKKDGVIGYASSSVFSFFEFKSDDFFDGVTLGSSGDQNLSAEKYDDFYIQGFAAVRPTDGKPMSGLISGKFEKEAPRFPKLILLLYRDFEKQSDYLEFIKTKNNRG